MKKILFLLSISIISANAVAEKNHEDHSHHHHSQLEVTDLAKQPKIRLKIHPDTKSGWNLEIVTDNFKFAPEQVNQAHELGKGHAHLFINGNKIGRLYGHWKHIDGLAPGMHVIKVTLNSNDHQDYAVKGVIVSDEVAIEQK